MADASNFIPQVDYTSRDYETIREDLINLIPNYAPNWTNRDSSDFGITLIELFSYMGDLLNFYIDRAANEGFLATASQRDSILRIASMLNYTPTESSPARASLTFTNTNSVAKTIPALTQIATTAIVDGVSTQIVFETDEEVVIPAKVGAVNGVAEIDATQGFTVANELLGTSNGNPNQVFKLAQSPVIGGSVSLSVNGITYNFIPFLIDATLFDPVFTTFSDSEGSTYVQFGDGVGGRIPPSSSTITATYRVGAGSAGNVPINKLTFFLTNVTAGVTVTNQSAAIGGADEESTDSIRTNSPLALRALNRAISLSDYTSTALQVPGVAKANADAEVYSSVILYIAPFGDPGVIGGSTTPTFDDLATRVEQYFIEKAPPNTNLTVLPPSYVPVNLEMTIYVLPQYKQTIVQNQVLSSIRELFDFDNSFFAEIIPIQYLLTAVGQVTGVDYATIELYRRDSDEQLFNMSNIARTSNIATITTSATHNFTVGQKVRVDNPSNTSLDGDHVVLSVTSDTFTFASIGGNIVSAPVSTGTVRALEVETLVCGVDEIPQEGTFNIEVEGGIA